MNARDQRLEAVEESGDGPEPNIAASVVDIAAELVQAPASAEITMLEWAFARIGAAADASVVAARELRDDGLLHFVAGWSQIDQLLAGEQPPLRLRHGRVPRQLVSATRLQDMPVIPVSTGDADDWQDLMGYESQQTVFIPMIASAEPKGFLCMVANDGVIWDDRILSALSTVTALVTQFRARVLAERSMQREIAFNEIQLKTGDRFLGVTGDEANDALLATLNDVGRLLDVTAIAVWERKAEQRAHRTLRWLNDGIVGDPSPPDPVDIDALPKALRPSGLIRTSRLTKDSHEMMADFDDLGVDRESLVVQMTTQRDRGGALVVAYSPGRQWARWEIAGLESFANRILILRDELAMEEQLMASFHAAPVGITIRNDQGRLVDCNEAFVSFLGYTSEVELLGSLPEDVMDNGGTAGHGAGAEIWRDQKADRIELPFTRKDGSIAWGRLSVRLLELGRELMTLTHVEDITAERLERIHLQERASTDELTGVANRHQMRVTLKQLLAMESSHADPHSASAAILLLDLDGFKQINDLHGHAVGDRVLQHVSRRLVNQSRDADTVVRLGGDEFVVILPGPVDLDAAQDAAMRIRNAVSQPLTVDRLEIRLTVSVGVATSTENRSVDSLLAAADKTMYAAKRVGGEMGQSAVGRAFVTVVE